MKNCQALFRVNPGPRVVKRVPSVLYEKVAVRPAPGRMSALTLSQIRPPLTGAPACSVPVPVVVQPLVDMVRPLVIDTRVVPLSLRMPIQADESRSRARPDRSPSAIVE